VLSVGEEKDTCICKVRYLASSQQSVANCFPHLWGGGHLHIFVCVCVCARACVRVCVHCKMKELS
jgi:hypothetical protein